MRIEYKHNDEWARERPFYLRFRQKLLWLPYPEGEIHRDRFCACEACHGAVR